MILRKDLKQKDLEAFEADYGPRTEGLSGRARMAGAAVRSAVLAGWFTDLTAIEDVDTLTGRQVIELSQRINDLYAEMVVLDPK